MSNPSRIPQEPSPNYSLAEFLQASKTLESRLDDAAKTSAPTSKGGETTVKQLEKDVADIVSRYHTNLSHELEAYDLKVCNDRLSRLSDSLAKLKASKSSKPKFSFKKRDGRINAASTASSPSHQAPAQPTGPAPALEPAAPYPPISPSGNNVHTPSFPGPMRISHHSDTHIRLAPTTQTLNTPFTLHTLDSCIIDLSPATFRGPLAAFSAHGIRRSILILGSVHGATHLTGLADTVVLVASRQVRMHASKRVRLYMRCASEPIIEDCEDVGVAPLPQGLWADYATDGVQADRWSEVKDFNVLGEDGTHWRVLEEGERVRMELWEEMFTCDDRSKREVLLRRLGIGG